MSELNGDAAGQRTPLGASDDLRLGRGDRRLTPQRRAVLEVLRAATDHPTAADVFDRVRSVHLGIGAATVYRTLGLLVDEGLAQELSLGDGASARYDGVVARHDHLVCDRCGRAVDVDHPIPAPLVDDLAATTGFVVTGYDLQFRGICPGCRTAPARPERALD